jgi:hypothetical protein
MGDKFIVWVAGIIAVCFTLIVISSIYFYHWKKIEMAKLGYEEVQIMKNAELGWQKVHH